jgi:hypothetical protein
MWLDGNDRVYAVIEERERGRIALEQAARSRSGKGREGWMIKID